MLLIHWFIFLAWCLPDLNILTWLIDLLVAKAKQSSFASAVAQPSHSLDTQCVNVTMCSLIDSYLISPYLKK